jgi:hypothetical protein
MALRNAYVEALQSQQLDALLLPPAALPALSHGASLDLTPIFSYAFLGAPVLLHYVPSILLLLVHVHM